MYPENDYDYETNRGVHLKVQVELYTNVSPQQWSLREVADRPLLSDDS